VTELQPAVQQPTFWHTV